MLLSLLRISKLTDMVQQSAAPNAGIAFELTIEHRWPGVGEPGRSTKVENAQRCPYSAHCSFRFTFGN
jgi:hypothetical protein